MGYLTELTSTQNRSASLSRPLEKPVKHLPLTTQNIFRTYPGPLGQMRRGVTRANLSSFNNAFPLGDTFHTIRILANFTISRHYTVTVKLLSEAKMETNVCEYSSCANRFMFTSGIPHKAHPVWSASHKIGNLGSRRVHDTPGLNASQ